mmetsp:Transcript_52604/g.140191  ORF Transcript_52604/g.140191 Transcript_52604/m.140191 type:complete len:238 (+) Transcript_52604:193-906(+)
MTGERSCNICVDACLRRVGKLGTESLLASNSWNSCWRKAPPLSSRRQLRDTTSTSCSGFRFSRPLSTARTNASKPCCGAGRVPCGRRCSSGWMTLARQPHDRARHVKVSPESPGTGPGRGQERTTERDIASSPTALAQTRSNRKWSVSEATACPRTWARRRTNRATRSCFKASSRADTTMTRPMKARMTTKDVELALPRRAENLLPGGTIRVVPTLLAREGSPVERSLPHGPFLPPQ